MGKKSRRARNRETRCDAAEHSEEDEGLIDFTTEDVARHVQIPAPSGCNGVIHPDVARFLLEWGRVLQTAKEAGYPDPSRTCISRLQMGPKKIKMTFDRCEPGPHALVSELEMIHHRLSREAIAGDCALGG